MTMQNLTDVAELMLAQDKGLLAIDESIGTCNRAARSGAYDASSETAPLMAWAR